MSGMTTQLTVLNLIDHNPTPAQLQQLKARMVDIGGDTVGPAPENFFADGVYGRKLVIPAGTLLVGKRQKHSNITVQLYGDIEVTTDDGPKRLVGQHVFVAPAGTERVGWTHAETAWVTCHATEETDMARIEADLTEPEPLEKLP
jgi:hypothetical protein